MALFTFIYFVYIYKRLLKIIMITNSISQVIIKIVTLEMLKASRMRCFNRKQF